MTSLRDKRMTPVANSCLNFRHKGVEVIDWELKRGDGSTQVGEQIFSQFEAQNG